MPAAPVLACVADNARGELVADVAQHWATLLGVEYELLHVSRGASRAAGAGWQSDSHRSRLRSAPQKGPVAWTICRRARDLDAQLVILGALEHDGPLAALFGSVARRVARTAPCSVLLLPHPESPAYGRVVASVGFDGRSIDLLDTLAEVVRAEPPSRLDVLHEVESYRDLMRTLGEPEPQGSVGDSTLQRESLDRLKGLLRESGLAGINGLDLRLKCLEGHAGHEAVEYARHIDADLLLVPAPPRMGLWDRFFKHPAEVVLQDLPCALLMHRPAATRNE